MELARCGQKLILMVGPSGAGKSTLAKRGYASDCINSSDDIRQGCLAPHPCRPL